MIKCRGQHVVLGMEAVGVLRGAAVEHVPHHEQQRAPGRVQRDALVGDAEAARPDATLEIAAREL